MQSDMFLDFGNDTQHLKPKTYTQYMPEEIMKSSIEYFGGDELAANVWMNKYALRDEDKIYELNPDMMHHRLASEFARIERNYPNPMSEETIYGLLKDFKYIIPQGSPMSGIGNNFQVVSLSNCFVIGNSGASDSYGGIMKIDQEQVQLMKRRGGVGHDLTHIRPAGSPVKNSALTSTGIVPFMERYSNTTREVAQGGRRGALMLSISIKHPNAEQFIDAKLEQGKITGANVSVKVTDEFMECVRDGKPFVQQYPVDSPNPTVRQEIDARKLWNKIIHNAWASAEPGVLFWDTILRESVPDCYADFGYRTVSTNPCGEIPLCPYDSCRLIAVNLFSYVKNPFTPEAEFDFDLFRDHITKAQRLMDDLIDLELEKVNKILAKIDADPESDDIKSVERNLWLNIKMKCLEGRRTGLGITAEGDMLAGMNLRYGTDEATDFAVKVQRTLACAAYGSSVTMAKERGSFPLYDANREKLNPFIMRLAEADPKMYAEMIQNGRRNIALLTKMYAEMIQNGRRNIALLTVAPTGTVSICTQTTSGIEPVFLVSYKRRKKINPNDKDTSKHKVVKDENGDYFEEYNVLHPKFIDWLKLKGYTTEQIDKMEDKEIDSLIAQSPYYKATSADIDWVNKVKMQGAIQKWVDHSISVTVNIPKETSEEIVSTIYQTAWESGCKGCTSPQTPQETGGRGRPLQERQRGLDCRRRHVRTPTLRNLHRPRRELRAAQVGGERMGHPRQRERRRTRPLRLPVPRPGRLPRHHRRPFAHVQERVLELRQAHQRHPAPRNAHPQCGGTYRQAELRRGQHHHLVQRCGPCAETLHQGRHRDRRDLSRLRRQDHLHRRLQELPQLRMVKVLVTTTELYRHI